MRIKSQGVSLFLTFLLGPIGLMYSSIWAGLIATAAIIPLMLLIMAGSVSRQLNPVIGPLGEYDVWHIAMTLACMLAGVLIVRRHNSHVQGSQDIEERRHTEILDALSKSAS